MNKSRLLAFCVASTVAFAACGQGTETADSGDTRNSAISRNWRVDVPASEIGAGSQYQAVAVAEDGSIYAAAQSTAAYRGAIIGDTDVVLTKFTAAGVEVWSRRFGSPASDVPNGVAIDPQGHVYVAGVTSGNIGAAPNGLDVFVKGFDTSGKEVLTWQKSSVDNQEVRGFAFDPVNSVMYLGFRNITKPLSGMYRLAPDGNASLVFSSDTETYQSVGVGPDGGFVVASSTTVGVGADMEKDTVVTLYSPDARAIWSRSLDFTAPSLAGTVSAGLSDDLPMDVGVSLDGTVSVVGNVYAAGRTVAELGFVASLAWLDGSVRWSHTLSPLDNDVAPAAPTTLVRNVVPTDSGEIWVTGESNQTFDVDFASSWTTPFAFKFSDSGGQLALRHEPSIGTLQKVRDAAAQPGSNRLVEVLSSGGTSILSLVDNPAEPINDGADVAQQFGTVGYDAAKDIAVGANGDYFVVGSFAGYALGSRFSGAGDRLVGFTAQQRWETQVVINWTTARITSVVATPDGGVAAAGSMDVTSGGVTTTDVWVAKWSRTGVRQWLTREVVSGFQSVSGLAAESDGTIVMTGQTETLFASGTPTKSTAFLSRYADADGARLSIAQWGGLNRTAPSDPVPVGPGEFVVASIEIDPTLGVSKGYVSVSRIRADGTVVAQGAKNPTPAFDGQRLVVAPDGSFVVGDIVSVATGVTSTTRVHLTGYSTSMERTFEVTLPQQGMAHRDCLSDIAVKPNGEILVVGTAYCTFTPAMVTRNNGMFLRLSSVGQIIEAKNVSKPLYDTLTAVAVGPNGDVWTAGTMVTLVMDGAPGTGDIMLRHYPGAQPPAATATTIADSTSTTQVLMPSTTSTVPAVATTTAPVTTAVAPVTTLAPATVTTVASTSSVRPSATTSAPPATVPPATAAPTTAVVTNSTVATPPAGTTVITVPVALDRAADQVANDKSGFAVEVGGTTVTGTVSAAGEVTVNLPSGLPVGKPFVTGLLPGNRSVTVEWKAVPGAQSYSVTASGGRLQSCSATGTTCTVTGLIPGYPYQFIVTAFGNLSAASDPSVPVKPVLQIGRKRSIAGSKVLPAPTDRKTKVSWKAKGACSVTPKGMIKAGKKIGTCSVTRRTTRTRLNPATAITFTVVIR